MHCSTMLTPAEELAAAQARIRGYDDALLRITRMFGAEHQTAVGIRACIGEAEKELADLQAKVEAARSDRNLTPSGYARSDWEEAHHG